MAEHSTVPTATVGLGKAAEQATKAPEKEIISHRRAEEVSWVASVLLNQKRKEGGDAPAVRVLDTAHFLGNLPKDKIAGANAALADGSAGSITFMVGDQKVQLTEILDQPDDKRLACKYQVFEDDVVDPTTGEVLSVGQLDTTRAFTAAGEDALLRTDAVSTYLLFEDQTILDGFDGDERAIVETHFALMATGAPLDEEPELKGQLERVAKDKLLTVGDLDGYLTGLVASGMCTDADSQTMRAALGSQGEIVLAPRDVRELLRVGGLDLDGLSERIQELGEEKTRLRGILDGQDPKSPEGRDTQKKLDQAEGAQLLCQQTQKLLETRDEEGRDPIDKFFDAAYKGDVDLSGEIIDAFRRGNLEQVTESVMNGMIPQGLSEGEKKAFKDKLLAGLTWENAGKVGKYGGIGLAVPVGLAAFIAALLAAAGLSLGGAMMKQAQ